MRLLGAEAPEASIADDGPGLEVLELGSVGTGIRGECDQVGGPVKVAVVVGRDVRDEVGGLSVADESFADAHRPRQHEPPAGLAAGRAGPHPHRP